MNTQTWMKRGFTLAAMMLGALPLSGVAASDVGTLTVGSVSGGCGSANGYNPPTGLGSYSPVGLTGGTTVTALVEEWHTCFLPPLITYFTVSGFSSNPGASWLTSVTCNGVTKVPSASYTYNSGSALWLWTNNPFWLVNKSGQNVSCTVVHN
jgi:hypothetical protein